MGIVGGGTFIIALNGTMLTVAVPFVAADFQARMAVAEWVLMSYLLATSALLLVFGRLGDTYGFRRIYLLGSVA
ncbi:MAG: MFS transporter, partial [Firmicutes bacterium]|nr:MFS transporter [Bacillota bacterium]